MKYKYNWFARTSHKITFKLFMWDINWALDVDIKFLG